MGSNSAFAPHRAQETVLFRAFLSMVSVMDPPLQSECFRPGFFLTTMVMYGCFLKNSGSHEKSIVSPPLYVKVLCDLLIVYNNIGVILSSAGCGEVILSFMHLEYTGYMDMRKKFITLVLFITIMLAVGAGVFWAIDAVRIARGLKPVLLKPARDITEIIPSIPQEKQKESVAENTTDFPLQLPNGFFISVYAKNLGNPRVMMWGPDGTIWTSIPSQGKVVSVRDTNGDGAADETVVVADGLHRPHGLASRCDPDVPCKVYIAESDQVAVYEYDAANRKVVNKKKIADLSDDGRHFTRTIMFM